MKNNISAIAVIVALSSGFYANSAKAEKIKIFNNDSKSESFDIKEKIKKTFTPEYSPDDLLNILADIEANLKTNNIDRVRHKSYEIVNYLNYHQSQSKKSDAKTLRSTDYKGDKVLEIQYGSWFGSKELILPLELENNSLTPNFLNKRITLAGFGENEINSAKIRYVSYDIENKGEHDLYNLLASIGEGDAGRIRKDIQKVYQDILIDHDDKVSLVAKIRDNLIVAKFMNDKGQFKAAKNNIGITDSLILRLIEATSDSPDQQARIKTLRKELNNTSKISDENYISEWEKIPDEVGNWWRNK